MSGKLSSPKSSMISKLKCAYLQRLLSSQDFARTLDACFMQLLINHLLDQLDLGAFSEPAQGLMKTWQGEALDILHSKKDFLRDDYLEFIELCTLFLGSEQTAKFKKPGTLHKVRWMAKLLYTIKICLLEAQIKELPAGTITTSQQVHRVREFVLFATLLYCTAPNG